MNPEDMAKKGGVSRKKFPLTKFKNLLPVLIFLALTSLFYRFSSSESVPEKKNKREEMLYYRELRKAIYSSPQQESILDVGSAFPPFLRRVNIPNRTVLAPYFVQYGQSPSPSNQNWTEYEGIKVWRADFMQIDIPLYSFDIVLCSQVMEHIKDAGAFMRKLLLTGKTVIVSVPYMWPNTNSLPEQRLRRFFTGAKKKVSHHKHDNIDEATLLKWSHGRAPDYQSIITEKNDGRYARRIVQVFYNFPRNKTVVNNNNPVQ